VGFGMVIGFVERLLLVTVSSYNCLMDLHTLQIAVTAAHIKSCMSSVNVAW
jgi:UDP-N-acetylglucosamine transferase subunit ALG13